MDTQLKRGMLDVCVLAAIKDDESHSTRMKPNQSASDPSCKDIPRSHPRSHKVLSLFLTVHMDTRSSKI